LDGKLGNFAFGCFNCIERLHTLFQHRGGFAGR
jgi:hypothetical protein